MENQPDKKGMKKVIYKEEYIDEQSAHITYEYVDIKNIQNMFTTEVHLHKVTILLPKSWLVLDDTGMNKVAGQELTRFWGELVPENLQFRKTERYFDSKKDAMDFISTTIYEINSINKINIDKLKIVLNGL